VSFDDLFAHIVDERLARNLQQVSFPLHKPCQSLVTRSRLALTICGTSFAHSLSQPCMITQDLVGPSPLILGDQ
jgi:hypothetical protein